MVKGIIATLMAATLILCTPVSAVYAEDYNYGSGPGESYINAVELQDNVEASSTVGYLQFATWFTYTVTQPGHYYFSFTNKKDSSMLLCVYDEDMNKIYDSIATDSKGKTLQFAYRPGTKLYVKLSNQGNEDVCYVTCHFTPATDWEQEFNDTQEQANPLTANVPEYGFFDNTEGDDDAGLKDYTDHDWYVFTAPEDGKVKFKVENYTPNYYLTWKMTVTDESTGKYKKYQCSEDNNLIGYSDEESVSKGSVIYVEMTGDGYINPSTDYRITPVFTENSETYDDDDISDEDEDDELQEAPAKVTGLTLKNLKGKKVKVSFNESYGSEGYEVRYRVKGKKAKTIDVEYKTSTKITVPKNKTVIVSVRAYNYSDGVEIQYGGWSSPKKIKTDRK